MIQGLGYGVVHESDPVMAAERLKLERYDIVISDYVMPGMDGHTLVQLVRHEMPDIKIVLMSGYSEDVFADDVERDPGVHFLAKPFSLKDLAGKVKEVMEG